MFLNFYPFSLYTPLSKNSTLSILVSSRFQFDDRESPPSHKEWLLVRFPFDLVYNPQAIFKDQININVKKKHTEKTHPFTSSRCGSVVNQNSLYFFCHSGLDPESSIFELDSRWSLLRT